MTENVQTDPNEIVTTFASSMATLGVNNLYSQGNPVLVLGIEHAQHIAAAGWTQARPPECPVRARPPTVGSREESRQVEGTALS